LWSDFTGNALAKFDLGQKHFEGIARFHAELTEELLGVPQQARLKMLNKASPLQARNGVHL
jgi:hypothetical protein